MSPPPLVLVDDDNRQVCARFLRIHGRQVREAADGREALARVQARRPDVIVMERSLPGLDGWQGPRLLKAGPGTRSIPVSEISDPRRAPPGRGPWRGPPPPRGPVAPPHQSNTRTVRAPSPLRMARKASLTSASLPRRVTISSRRSRPWR